MTEYIRKSESCCGESYGWKFILADIINASTKLIEEYNYQTYFVLYMGDS